MPIIEGSGEVGGLIGRADGSVVSNSYVKGNVMSTSSSIGGLIGFAGGSVSNSYATGAVTGGMRRQGGFIGDIRSGGGVTGKNYFVNSSGGTNGIGGNAGCSSCMRETLSGIRMLTSSVTSWTTGATGNWDFGTTSQSPALKYAQNPTPSPAPRWCGSGALPACGSLIPGQR